ncbi:hypothetical protein PR202_ga10161 [Eleusine coracana subsp. coracana]|uniref:TF-B3 domain-containing protein n=1 Tax=Eleusine coracana subsp. coracana TaxID=191504 RepID=A0AAV5C615_ELECO|nr:hypothetical protein PR202_ga10161 [Eleusine coracana subsp. coracana]
MVVFDQRAAAQRLVLKRDRQEDEAEASTSSSSRAGKRARQEDEDASASASASSSGVCADAVVLDVKPINAVAPGPSPLVVLDVQPINAVAPGPPPPLVVLDVQPINAVAPGPLAVLDDQPINAIAPPRQPPPPPATDRELPRCVREHFLPALGLRADLPVHFIAEKVVTSTDVDAHQNRFRIPLDGVERCLRAILTPAELHAANLLHDMAPRKRTKKMKENEEEEGAKKKMKEPKKKGKVHGGLRVRLVNLAAGAKELQMSRWDSSRATVVKGEGYLDFVRRCSFREGDVVEVWAFLQRHVRIFGVDVQRGDGVLHVLVVKKNQPQCCYCPVIPHAQ